jgi:hypothetical protein
MIESGGDLPGERSGNDHIHGYSRVPGTEIAALCMPMK